ncbi:MAG: ribose-phosphate pyrophosphokinase [Crenarchaeota archaeon]|nr:ribose-phosphate pyrophosphokinase [Thermoproteota archaeon]MDA1125067.1 ribose-phosphate pyrophosphokinase [Thermoproteota archaeon]
MEKFTVVGGDSSPDLAKRIARKLKSPYIKTEKKIFPDGESKITINPIPKKNIVIVVQSTNPPVDSNLLELLSIVSKVQKFSSKVYAVIPYMGYARQDREFLGGEIITISVVGKLLKAAGVKKILTVDIHSKLALKELKIPSENVSAMEVLVKHFKKMKMKDPLVVSPDLGGKERAEKFSNLLKTDFVALKKHRDRKTGKVNILSGKVNVKNRDIILVDDIVSTGGSIMKATQFLKKQKCRRVFVACTHALLINDAAKKIKNAGVTQIISTNTIPGESAKVDVSKVISDALR